MTNADRFRAALSQHQLGRFDDAAAGYRAVLAAAPDHFEALRNLAAIAHRAGRLDEAIDGLSRAVRLRPDDAALHNQLAAAQLSAGRFAEAETGCRAALALSPDLALAHLNLGNVFQIQGRFAEAADAYRAAVRCQPNFVDAHNNLGMALKCLGRLDEAIAAYREALRLAPHHAGALVNLGNVYNAQARIDDAIACCQEAVRAAPNYATAHANLGNFLQAQGKIDQAAAAYRAAARIAPNPTVRHALATMLPILYDSSEHLEAYRAEFVAGVTALANEGVALDPLRSKLQPHFFLAYQGKNDRDVMRLLARLCGLNSRDYVIERPNRAAGDDDGRTRVGFISSFFKDHTIGLLSRGLIARLSRERFEVVVLSLSAGEDAVGQAIRQSADRTIELPADLAVARDRIAELRLDVLYYTDVGMDPAAYALAASRLAPVQVVTWGHPVTTGLPTIDYFLSSELFEPHDAAEHYTETLVPLPTISVCYERPTIATPRLTRGELGLSDARHVYLCPQTLFKLHPDFDAALAGILRRDAAGEVVLIEGRYANWTELLRRRLARTMSDCVDRVRFVPARPRAEFLHLLAAADVMLDTFHFGGGNTTYEALAVGTPVVTLPSAFLRGRITLGCYRKLGVLDCVAADERHYVDLAVRIGTDRDYRAATSAKLLAASDSLFDDAGTVEAVEAFLERAVTDARRKL